MKSRCYSPNNPSFEWYGAKGIKVDERWVNSFSTFYADVGPRPSKAHSLDRIDSSKDYGPENCRWADSIQQARNRSNNKPLTINGVTKLECEWIEKFGIKKNVFYKRMYRGWSPERALSEPSQYSPKNANSFHLAK